MPRARRGGSRGRGRVLPLAGLLALLLAAWALVPGDERTLRPARPEAGPSTGAAGPGAGARPDAAASAPGEPSAPDPKGPGGPSAARARVEAGGSRVLGTVVDPAGSPLAGAEVQVFPAPFHGPERVPAGEPVRPLASLVTAADGRFDVAVPAAEGFFGVTVRAPGHARGSRNQHPGVDVDFALRPAARLEGRALEEGLAVEGVRVVLSRVGWDGRARSDAEVAVTAADGGYAFEELPLGGSAALDVERPGYLPFRVVVDLEDPATRRDLVFDESFWIVGHVVDEESGRGVEGASVRLGSLELRAGPGGRFLCPVAGDPARAARGTGPGRAATRLVAWAPGCCATHASLDLREAMRGPFEVPLLRAGSIRGTVRTADGAPAAGAVVEWFEDWSRPLGPAAEAGPSERSRRAEAAADGTFELPEVVPGADDATLVVRLPGAPELVVGDVAPASAGEERVLDLRLGAGLSVQGQLFELGRPTPGVVELEVLADGTTRRTPADAHGRYAFDGLPAGAVRVRGRLGADPLWGSWVRGRVGPESWLRADVRVPAREARLSGRLVDGALRPQAGALLWVARRVEGVTSHEAEAGSGRADAEGRFELDVQVRETECFALCTRWGTTSLEWVEQCLGRGWTKDGLELVVPELREVELVLRRMDSRSPVRGARVRWVRRGGDLEGQWGLGAEVATQSGHVRGLVPVGAVDLFVSSPERGLREVGLSLTGAEPAAEVELWP